MKLFDRKSKKIPVWFMRQAGRYHSHYQKIKKNSHFMEMCKDPMLACKITRGPVDAFHFDAAILFSDILFPLERLGLGLTYVDGPPRLDKIINSIDDIGSLRRILHDQSFYDFQKKALILLKTQLDPDIELLGFIGAPFTLYAYALEGCHSGHLTHSKKGFYDQRFDAFMDILLPELIESMTAQAEGGADVLCIFDTAVGELDLFHFKKYALTALRYLTKIFKERYPQKKIIYYSKQTPLSYLLEIQDPHIDCLAIDWRVDLSRALLLLGKDYYIQGNLDPSLLHLDWLDLKKHWENLWDSLRSTPSIPLDKFIAALGHGVTPKTPESNVKKSVAFIHDHFHVP